MRLPERTSSSPRARGSATHSTLLLAYPDSTIYALGADGIEPVAYEHTDHYRLTRDFLGAPERFLRQLSAEPKSRQSRRALRSLRT
jgi:hypothetical protein